MNVLPLPESFDQNEWFVLILLIVMYSVLFLKRNKFPLSITILILLFSAAIARIFDHVLAGPPVDLYDLMDTANFDLFDFLSYLLYGPFAILFLRFYEKLNICGLYTLLFLLIWAVFSVLFEWITVLFNVFTFNEWKHLYSFPVPSL